LVILGTDQRWASITVHPKSKKTQLSHKELYDILTYSLEMFSHMKATKHWQMSQYVGVHALHAIFLSSYLIPYFMQYKVITQT